MPDDNHKDLTAVQRQHFEDEMAIANKNIHKLIVKDKLIYEARVIDPDQADWLAKANGLGIAENFTTRFDGCTIHVDHSGKIVRNLTQEKKHFLRSE